MKKEEGKEENESMTKVLTILILATKLVFDTCHQVRLDF